MAWDRTWGGKQGSKNYKTTNTSADIGRWETWRFKSTEPEKHEDSVQQPLASYATRWMTLAADGASNVVQESIDVDSTRCYSLYKKQGYNVTRLPILFCLPTGSVNLIFAVAFFNLEVRKENGVMSEKGYRRRSKHTHEKKQWRKRSRRSREQGESYKHRP